MNRSYEQATHPWLATDYEVAQVASHLGIPLEPGSESEITENYSRIFLVTGDGGEQRLLKIRARWMTKRRLRFEHALVRHLRGHGLPVVRPLSVTEISGLYCEVLPYIDGREAGRSLADVRLMGELLGRFHRSSSDLDCRLYEPSHIENQASPRELAAEVAQLGRETADAETIIDLWRRLDVRYRREAVSLPQVVRHGDFHPWNILFRKDEPADIAVLLDFDMSAPGARVFDISYTLFFLRFLHSQPRDDEWETRYYHFVKAYAGTCGPPLSEHEVGTVPLHLRSIALGFLVRKATEAGLASTDTSQEYENYLALDAWLETKDCPLNGWIGSGR